MKGARSLMASNLENEQESKGCKYTNSSCIMFSWLTIVNASVIMNYFLQADASLI